MYYVYILVSKKFGRHYIGMTTNVPKRLKRHNSKHVRSTKAYTPWVLVYKEEYANKNDARRREVELKINFKARQIIYDKLCGPIV
jgi:putative endonuclease